MFNIVEIIKVEKNVDFTKVSKLKKFYFHHLKHELIQSYNRLSYVRNALLNDIEECVRFRRKRDFDIESDLIQTIHEFENVYVKYSNFINYLNGGRFPSCH